MTNPGPTSQETLDLYEPVVKDFLAHAAVDAIYTVAMMEKANAIMKKRARWKRRMELKEAQRKPWGRGRTMTDHERELFREEAVRLRKKKLTIDEIAAEIGLSDRTVYRLLQSKESTRTQ